MTPPPMLYPSCPKCDGMMLDGYLLDSTDHGALTTLKFVDGEPKRSAWVGLKVNPEQLFAVTVYRCIDCGFLESYAKPMPKKA